MVLRGRFGKNLPTLGTEGTLLCPLDDLSLYVRNSKARKPIGQFHQRRRVLLSLHRCGLRDTTEAAVAEMKVRDGKKARYDNPFP